MQALKFTINQELVVARWVLASHAFKKLALHYTNKQAIILHESKDLIN